jgi:hypothetical protein
MPLNIASSGDFVPYLKYDAKSGRFKVKPDGTDQWVEIRDFNLAFDMEHIRTGWIWYPQDGAPPHKMWSPSVSADVGPRPGLDYKLGFEVMVYGNTIIPGTNSKIGLRSWSANAFCTVSSINEMYAAFEKELPANPGKCPIYAFKTVKETEGAYINYKPVFELVAWADKSKVPAFEAHQASKVEVLPPPPRNQALGNIGNGRVQTAPTARQNVIEHRANYDLSQNREVPQPTGETSDEVPW